MSVATPLFAPEYDGDVVLPLADPASEPSLAPDRRSHLRAVPTSPVAPPRPSRRTVASIAPRRGPSVSVLLAPEPERAPVRLTRRGLVVLALLVAAVGGALIWVAALSAPSDAAPGGAGPAGVGPAVVTVEAGDTLWSIATRVAPGVDPRAEVEHLRDLNDLDGVALVPGQQLRAR